MKTVVIQIGNSDDKLPQRVWNEFISAMHMVAIRMASEIHFAGCSNPDQPWQNACFVMEIQQDDLAELRQQLTLVAGTFRQDSIAMTIGETEMVKP